MFGPLQPQPRLTTSGRNPTAGGRRTPCAPVTEPRDSPQPRISEPSDPLEREAERVASVVTSTPSSTRLDPSMLQSTGSTASEPHIHRSPQGSAPASSRAQGSLADAIQRPRANGAPLPGPLGLEMSRRIGHDFSDVRIHRDSEADRLARSIHALAFTSKRDIFFRRGSFDPHTQGGRRLLAHELTHVVQQRQGAVPAGELPVQRAIDFAPGAAAAKAQEVDDQGNVSESTELFWEFVSGLSHILGFGYEHDPKDPFRIVKLDDISSEVSRIESAISSAYASPIQVQSAGGGFEYVDRSKALDIWRATRKSVNTHVKKGFQVIESSSSKFSGPMAEHKGKIHVKPDWVESTYIRESSGWSLFWMMLHEMLHLAGYDDAMTSNNMFGSPKQEERDLNIFGSTSTERVSLIGDVEFRLNVIRLGLGLPVRTNYTDVSPGMKSNVAKPTAVLFSDDTGPGRNEYVGSVIVDPSLDAAEQHRRAGDLFLPKDYDLAKAVAERRDKEAREKGARMAPGLEVSKFEFSDGSEQFSISDPSAIQIVVSSTGDLSVSGRYEYTKASGQHRTGLLSGGYFTYDKGQGSIHIVFDWFETAEGWSRRGSADLALDPADSKRLDYGIKVQLTGSWSTHDDRASSRMAMSVTKIMEEP